MRNQTLSQRLLRARWPLALIAAIALLVFTYWLIPMWLDDDHYTQVLIPDFQLPLNILCIFCLIVALIFFIGDKNPQRSPMTIAPLARQTLTKAQSHKSIINTLTEHAINDSYWNSITLRNLSAPQFELLCINYYQIKGVQSSTCDLGSDGGINIRIHSGHRQTIHRIIHCCADFEKIVGVSELRGFLGVMMHERATTGVFIHLGALSDDARLFAEANQIQIRDDDELLSKINQLSNGKKVRLRKLIEKSKI